MKPTMAPPWRFYWRYCFVLRHGWRADNKTNPPASYSWEIHSASNLGPDHVAPRTCKSDLHGYLTLSADFNSNTPTPLLPKVRPLYNEPAGIPNVRVIRGQDRQEEWQAEYDQAWAHPPHNIPWSGGGRKRTKLLGISSAQMQILSNKVLHLTA